MKQTAEHIRMTEDVMTLLSSQEVRDSAGEVIKLRRAAEQDRDFVDDLTFRTMIELVSEYWPEKQDQDIYFKKNSFDAYPSATLVMLSPKTDDRIGRVTVRYVVDPTRTTDLAMLEEIHLEPHRQGRATATKIIAAIKDLVSPANLALIVLRNNPAVGLYEKLGFAVRSDDGLDDTYRYFMECSTSTNE